MYQNIGTKGSHISQGFTLIELVIVIIVLGILAATALPSMIDVSGDARESAVKSVAGTFQSIDTLVYSKSVLLGIEKEDRSSDQNVEQTGFEFEGQFIQTIFGHPWFYDVSSLGLLLNIEVQDEGLNDEDKVCDYNAGFCAMTFNTGSAPGSIGIDFEPGGAILVYPAGMKVADNCFAYHIFDRTNNGVIIGSTITGCE